MVYSAQDIADTFASHLQSHFNIPALSENPLHDSHVAKSVLITLSDPTPSNMEPFSPEELSFALRGINPRKAPGPDDLPGYAILHSPPHLKKHLLSIFNSILSFQHFPSQWKISKIILLRKPFKSATDPSSYRPISLLPLLSKLFEKLLHPRLRQIIDPILRPEQFGFRQGHSTTQQLLRVVTAFLNAKNSHRHTTAVLLDFKAAFDRVWHLGLLYKLSLIFPPPVVRLIHSYLASRYFFVSPPTQNFHIVSSSLKPILAGVPQGSVLGPLLYLLFANDLPLQPSIHLGLYADDAILFRHSLNLRLNSKHLQQQLLLILTWCRTWKISVNPSKCEAIHFTEKRKFPQPLQIDDHQLPWKPKVKYLGVTLDSRLSFKSHVDEKICKGRILLLKLSPLLRSKTLNTTIKLLIYSAIIRSFLLYGAPVWWPLLSKSNKKKLSSLHNKSLRLISKFHYLISNSTIHQHFLFPTLEEFIDRTSRNLHDRGRTSTIQLMRELYETVHPPEVKKNLPFHDYI